MAIKAFTAAISAPDLDLDMDLISSLRESFSSRIDELEDFFSDNDSDDRAVLFEKQRLRLRQALQMANPTPKKKAPDGTVSPLTTPVKSATLGSSSTTTPNSAHRNSATKGMKSPASGSPHKKKSQTPPKPLYNWEKPATPVQVEKERVAIASPHGEFIPSLSAGFYELQNALPTSTKFIDFQVVLTESDYQDLLTRRRRLNAEATHTARFASKKHAETPYLNASTPYVDVSKVQASLYRS